MKFVISEECLEFEVHACFNEIVVPKNYSIHDLNSKLDLIVKYGSGGFGQV